MIVIFMFCFELSYCIKCGGCMSINQIVVVSVYIFYGTSNLSLCGKIRSKCIYIRIDDFR